MDKAQPISVQVHHRYSVANLITFAFAGVITMFIIVGVGLGLLAAIYSEGGWNGFSHLFLVPLVTSIYGVIGIQITLRYPTHKIGWLLLIVAICSAVTLLSGTYGRFAHYVIPGENTPVADFMVWLNTWVWWIPSLVPLTFLLLYFPDGRLPSRRWQPLAIILLTAFVLITVSSGFHPGELEPYGLNNRNPYGIPALASEFESLLNGMSIVLFIGIILSFVSIAIRYRRAQGIERIQLKWLVYAAGWAISILILWYIVSLLVPVTPFIMEMGMTLTTVGVTLVIMAIGIAILKHQLWNIDTLINRTLVYGLLWMMIAAAYIVMVTFFSIMFEGETLVLSLMATALVAVSFQPLRDWLQRHINHLMFGHRDEPYIVLERLSKQLEPVVVVDEVLPTIVMSIGQALQLPFVAIALAQDRRYEIAATYPQNAPIPAHETLTKLPLEYHSENIGQLWLAPRGQAEVFSRAESSLLEALARQASIAAYNVRLTTELQRSREQLVTTREEERRRLRRDLHDGLGPVLAAMSFKLDAVHNLIGHDPERAQAMTSELKSQVQSSLSEIRRIAYNLRPPALDELGLLGALYQHIEAAQQPDGVSFTLEFPPSLPALPAAVEVAAYRTIMEAITNVQRHADAHICTVRIRLDEQTSRLVLDVIDDGSGIPAQATPGIGLTAMRERAEELGGQLTIHSTPNQGTHIQTQIPLSTHRGT